MTTKIAFGGVALIALLACAGCGSGLANVQGRVTLDGKEGSYRAIPVTGVEHDRVDSQNSLGVVFRILTGFPPRYFVRLDPS